MTAHLEPTETRQDPTGPRRRPLVWLGGGIALAAVVAVGGVFLYTKVINDPEAELTTAELDKALDAPTTLAADGTETTGGGDTTASTAAGSTATAAGSGAASAVTGDWTVLAAEPTLVGYRVEEVLFGVNTTATGRTSQVTGSLTIDGTKATVATFTVDVASIASDDSRRDNQFDGRIMSASQFPTATFALTQPVDFGSVPAEGAQVTAKATGDLTLRGVTRPVTFDLTAQLEGGRIGVLGNIPVTFTDYEIPSPSFAGIEVEPTGLLEFVLVFQRG